MAADPNMRCVCGFRRFRETVTRSVETVERWVNYDSGSYGFGSTPFGTYFGSGASGDWGLFEQDVPGVRKSLTCESCNRTRDTQLLAYTGVYGSYVLGQYLYIVTTGYVLLSCFRVRFYSAAEGITVDVSPSVYSGVPLPLSAPAPATTAATPPPGAVLAQVLRVSLPDVDHDGEYDVLFIDDCAGTEVPLTTLSLESAVQNHVPSQADLNGIPPHVVHNNLRASMPSAQPASGLQKSIPFDWCRTVIEYDARFGNLPAADGWSESAAPDAVALIPGAALSLQTSSAAYYEQEVVVPAAITSVYAYAKYWVSAADGAAPGEGFFLSGDGAPGSSGDYYGVNMRARAGELASKTLIGAGEDVVVGVRPRGWMEMLAGMTLAEPDALVAHPDGSESLDHATVWGTGLGGGASPTLRARFGDYVGSNVVTYLRNFVVSEPGRFMRAFFRSYAAAATQTLRLHLLSDVDGAGGTSARFRVRYGPSALGADPFSLATAYTSDVTASFVTRNQIVEAVFGLTGLAARQPFWFSVERLWGHADDTTQATIHMLDAVVRSS